MDKINQDTTLGAKYTAQVDNNTLVLTNRTAGAATDAVVKLSGGDASTGIAKVATAKVDGKDAGVTAFKAGESVTIAGKVYQFYDSSLAAGTPGQADPSKAATTDKLEVVGVDIKGRHTIENQMTALALKVQQKSGADYDITNQDGGAITAYKPEIVELASYAKDTGGGTLVFTGLLKDDQKLYLESDDIANAADLADAINNAAGCLYTAVEDNGKITLTAKEGGVKTDITVDLAEPTLVKTSQTDGSASSREVVVISKDSFLAAKGTLTIAGVAAASVVVDTDMNTTLQDIADAITVAGGAKYTASFNDAGDLVLTSIAQADEADVTITAAGVTANASVPPGVAVTQQGTGVEGVQEVVKLGKLGATITTGTLTLQNVLEGTGTAAHLDITVTSSTTNESIVAEINKNEKSLYTAKFDGKDIILTAKEIGDKTNVAVAATAGANGLSAAISEGIDDAAATKVKSFTLTSKEIGEDATLTELQYTSETEDGVSVGTQGPLNSEVVAGVNKSEALDAKNATVTYELSLGDKSEITNGSEIIIGGKTFKIFDSDKAVVEAGATMNESIVLENTKDEVSFTFATALDRANTIGASPKKDTIEIAGQKFTLKGSNVVEMYHNLQSAFDQSDLADKYTLTITTNDPTNTADFDPTTITGIKFAAKDAATDVSALEVKFDGTAITGQYKSVETGEEKLAKAIQNKVSALTGIVNEVSVKDGKITFEAEYSDITGEEFMAQMGQLGFNANVEDAPELAKVELEKALVGEYEAVTAEDMTNGVTFQIGANGDADQRVKLQIGDMGSKALGIADVDLTTSDGANKAIDVIDAAIQNVSAQRAQLGAMQNRLEHTINNLDTNNENLSAAESRIRDVDMAAEMMAYTKNNVLVQAAQSMLAQANQQPQSVLSLLQ